MLDDENFRETVEERDRIGGVKASLQQRFVEGVGQSREKPGKT